MVSGPVGTSSDIAPKIGFFAYLFECNKKLKRFLRYVAKRVPAEKASKFRLVQLFFSIDGINFILKSPKVNLTLALLLTVLPS
jgi:hypothetical protein